MKNLTLLRKTNLAGFSMVETVGVIAIIATLSLVVILAIGFGPCLLKTVAYKRQIETLNVAYNWYNSIGGSVHATKAETMAAITVPYNNIGPFLQAGSVPNEAMDALVLWDSEKRIFHLDPDWECGEVGGPTPVPTPTPPPTPTPTPVPTGLILELTANPDAIEGYAPSAIIARLLSVSGEPVEGAALTVNIPGNLTVVGHTGAGTVTGATGATLDDIAAVHGPPEWSNWADMKEETLEWGMWSTSWDSYAQNMWNWETGVNYTSADEWAQSMGYANLEDQRVQWGYSSLDAMASDYGIGEEALFNRYFGSQIWGGVGQGQSFSDSFNAEPAKLTWSGNVPGDGLTWEINVLGGEAIDRTFIINGMATSPVNSPVATASITVTFNQLIHEVVVSPDTIPLGGQATLTLIARPLLNLPISGVNITAYLPAFVTLTGTGDATYPSSSVLTWDGDIGTSGVVLNSTIVGAAEGSDWISVEMTAPNIGVYTGAAVAVLAGDIINHSISASPVTVQSGSTFTLTGNIGYTGQDVIQATADIVLPAGIVAITGTDGASLNPPQNSVQWSGDISGSGSSFTFEARGDVYGNYVINSLATGPQNSVTAAAAIEVTQRLVAVSIPAITPLPVNGTRDVTVSISAVSEVAATLNIATPLGLTVVNAPDMSISSNGVSWSGTISSPLTFVITYTSDTVGSYPLVANLVGPDNTDLANRTLVVSNPAYVNLSMSVVASNPNPSYPTQRTTIRAQVTMANAPAGQVTNMAPQIVLTAPETVTLSNPRIVSHTFQGGTQVSAPALVGNTVTWSSPMQNQTHLLAPSVILAFDVIPSTAGTYEFSGVATVNEVQRTDQTSFSSVQQPLSVEIENMGGRLAGGGNAWFSPYSVLGSWYGAHVGLPGNITNIPDDNVYRLTFRLTNPSSPASGNPTTITVTAPQTLYVSNVVTNEISATIAAVSSSSTTYQVDLLNPAPSFGRVDLYFRTGVSDSYKWGIGRVHAPIVVAISDPGGNFSSVASTSLGAITSVSPFIRLSSPVRRTTQRTATPGHLNTFSFKYGGRNTLTVELGPGVTRITNDSPHTGASYFDGDINTTMYDLLDLGLSAGQDESWVRVNGILYPLIRADLPVGHQILHSLDPIPVGPIID